MSAKGTFRATFTVEQKDTVASESATARALVISHLIDREMPRWGGSHVTITIDSATFTPNPPEYQVNLDGPGLSIVTNSNGYRYPLPDDVKISTAVKIAALLNESAS